MLHNLDLAPTLHRFPIPHEFENIDYVDLAEKAREDLAQFAGSTVMPRVQESQHFSYGSNKIVFLRADELKTGCFKLLSAMTSARRAIKEGYTECVTGTAGSYGRALGYAMRLLGGRVIAYVPETISNSKRQGMVDQGVTVMANSRNVDEALLRAEAHAQTASEGGKKVKYIHPFATLDNIVGTGTLGLDIDATHVVLQYGGGSLASGISSVLKQKQRDGGEPVHITAVQVEHCSPFVDSVLSGELCESQDFLEPNRKSYFSSLGGVGVGDVHPLNLGIASQAIDNAVTVSRRDAYASMYDCEVHEGFTPEIAAVPGLVYARKLVRSPNIENATVAVVITGNRPDSYPSGFLRRMSQAYHQEDLLQSNKQARRPALTATGRSVRMAGKLP